MGFARKIQKAIHTRGLLGTLSLAWKVLTAPPRDLSTVDQDFDERYGTDTSGYIPAPDLNGVVNETTWDHGTAYQGVNADTDFDAWLSPHIADVAPWAFVDAGSGKGRAVMLASRLPFREVLGVEYSRQLHDIARANLDRWPPAEVRAKAIGVICADATEAELPGGPLVVFMHNPFDATLMARFASRFVGRIDPLLVVYFTPHHAQVWDGVPGLSRVDERPGAVIWKR